MKQSVDNLALFGGSPSFREPLHVGCPNVPDREQFFARLNDLLDRRYLTNDGPFVREFEQRICDQLGVPHCIAMCSGTVALEIVYRALGLSGEVIVPSFTFVATAHALRWQQVTPVFCDIDPETHNLDPVSVRKAISSRTTGIIGVHLWGNPCNVAEIMKIGHEHNLRVVFDASHAFGCTHGGIPIGSFGDAEVFSFHATKFVNTFEGGAVVTRSGDLAEKLRSMRNFGFSGYDRVSEVGTNGKLSEVSAAMGLGCLDAQASFLLANQTNRETYQARLSGLEGVRFLPVSQNEKHNLQYVVVEVGPTSSGLTRDELLRILWAENVRCRKYFFPGCHRMAPYRSLGSEELSLPQTELVAEIALQFPTGTAVTPSNVERICDLVEFCLSHGAEIRDRMRFVE